MFFKCVNVITIYTIAGVEFQLLIKAKFHYSIWSQTGPRLVTELLARASELDDRPNSSSLYVSDQLRTCLRPDSVMEFDFEPARTWSQAGSKPNSITLSGLKLVRSWSQTGSKLVADLSQTC